MHITYTEYAEETLLERTIPKKIVEEVILNPDEIVEGKKGRKIAHKIPKFPAF